jgi:hypothetical protein
MSRTRRSCAPSTSRTPSRPRSGASCRTNPHATAAEIEAAFPKNYRQSAAGPPNRAGLDDQRALTALGVERGLHHWYDEVGAGAAEVPVIGVKNSPEFSTMLAITSPKKPFVRNVNDAYRAMLASRIMEKNKLWTAPDSLDTFTKIFLGKPDALATLAGRIAPDDVVNAAQNAGTPFVSNKQIEELHDAYQEGYRVVKSGAKTPSFGSALRAGASNDYTPGSTQDLHMARGFGALAIPQAVFDAANKEMDQYGWAAGAAAASVLGKLKATDPIPPEHAHIVNLAKVINAVRNPVVDGRAYALQSHITEFLGHERGLNGHQAQAAGWGPMIVAYAADPKLVTEYMMGRRPFADVLKLIDPILSKSYAGDATKAMRDPNNAEMARRLGLYADVPSPADVGKPMEMLFPGYNAAKTFPVQHDAQLAEGQRLGQFMPRVSLSATPGRVAGGGPDGLTLDQKLDLHRALLANPDVYDPKTRQFTALRDLGIRHEVVVPEKLSTFEGGSEPSLWLRVYGNRDTAKLAASLIGEAWRQDGAGVVVPNPRAVDENVAGLRLVKSDLAAMAERPYVRGLASAVAQLHSDVLNQVRGKTIDTGKREVLKDSYFLGLGVTPEWYGLNMSPRAGLGQTDYHILMNPWAALDGVLRDTNLPWAQRFADRDLSRDALSTSDAADLAYDVAMHMYGTMVHEIAHNAARSEGEPLSRALTDLLGRIRSRDSVNIQDRLAEAINPILNNEIARATWAADTSAVLKLEKKNVFAKESLTRTVPPTEGAGERPEDVPGVAPVEHDAERDAALPAGPGPGVRDGAAEPGPGRPAGVRGRADVGREPGRAELPGVADAAGSRLGRAARAVVDRVGGGNQPLGIVPPGVARHQPGGVKLPGDARFRDAVKRTPGAEITPEGLKLDLTRWQKPEQANDVTGTKGVFYTAQEHPEGFLSYQDEGEFGGEQGVSGPTILRRPLVTTGNSDGEHAGEGLRTLLGAQRNGEMGIDVSQLSQRLSKPYLDGEDFAQAGEAVPAIKAFLRKWGGDPASAEAIYKGAASSGDKEDFDSRLYYALQHNVLAERATKAGYDSVVGVTNWKTAHYATEELRKSGPMITEVFDLRESHYPTAEGGFTLHDQFKPPGAAGGAYDKAPTFYSQLERAVADAKSPVRAPADQWRGWLKSAGVKADELKWTGFDQFLHERAMDKKPVTRDEALKFVQANRVEVKEVVNGEPRPLPAGSVLLESLGRGESAIVRDGQRIGNVHGTDDGYRVVLEGKPSPSRPFSTENDVRGWLTANVGPWHPSSDARRPTKFGKYTLPGGENYRELLLTLPEKDRSVEKADLFKRYQAKEMTQGEFQKQLDRLDFDDTYSSKHWNEPNVLAHVRFNDRTDAAGKKTLFIEEFQSDWHTDGHTEGYWQPPAPLSAREVKPGIWQAFDGDSEIGAPDRTRDGALENGQQIREYVASDRSVRDPRPPDAPFVRQSWPELAMKRMIRWAAENGYDKVAWTTGDQQAERYDLRKKVYAIQWDPSDGRLQGWSIDGESGEPAVDLNVERDKLPQAVGREVAERLLKSPRQAQLHGAHYLTGDDLAVGGESKGHLYDQQMVNIANDLGKKFGARVVTAKQAPKAPFTNLSVEWADPKDAPGVRQPVYIKDVDGTRYGGPVPYADASKEIERIRAEQTPADRRTKIVTGERGAPQQITIGRIRQDGEWVGTYIKDAQSGDPIAGPFDSRDAAEAHWQSMLAEHRKLDKTTIVHSIDITPQMRESAVTKGFPLFARAGGAGESGRSLALQGASAAAGAIAAQAGTNEDTPLRERVTRGVLGAEAGLRTHHIVTGSGPLSAKLGLTNMRDDAPRKPAPARAYTPSGERPPAPRTTPPASTEKPTGMTNLAEPVSKDELHADPRYRMAAALGKITPDIKDAGLLERWHKLSPDDAVGRYKLLAEANRPGHLQIARSVMVGNMLGSLKTAEIVFGHGATLALNEPFKRGVKEGKLDEAAAQLGAMGRASLVGLRNAAEAFKTGIGPESAKATLLEGDAKRPVLDVPGKAGMVLTPGLRTMSAAHEFWRTVATHGLVAAEAVAESKRIGRPVAELLARPTKRMLDNVDRLVPEAMHGDTSSILAQKVLEIQHLANRDGAANKIAGNVAHWLVPFVRIPDWGFRKGVSIATGPIKKPFDMAMDLKRGDMTALRGDAAVWGMTTAFMLGTYGLVENGTITGPGPADATRRAELEATGWRPFSIKIGDRYMDYETAAGPFAVPFAAVSAAHDAAHYEGQKGVNADVARAVSAGVAKAMLGSLWLRGVASLVGSIEGGKWHPDVEAFGESTSSRLVPGIVTQVANAVDPRVKAPESVLQAIMAHIPVASRAVPSKVGLYGDEETRPQDLVSTLLPGRSEAPKGTTPAAMEVARLEQAGHPVPVKLFSAHQQKQGAVVSGAAQSGAQIRTLQSALGRAAEAAVNHYLSSPEYARLSDEQKATTLKAALAVQHRAVDRQLGDQLARDDHGKALMAWYSVPQYAGVSGSIDQIRMDNFRAAEAHAKLSAYRSAYGAGVGDARLAKEDPATYRFATLHPALPDPYLKLKKNQVDQQSGGALSNAESRGLVGAGATVLDAEGVR